MNVGWIALVTASAAMALMACGGAATVREGGRVEPVAKRIIEAYQSLPSYEDTGTVTEERPHEQGTEIRRLAFETTWRRPDQLLFRVLDDHGRARWTAETKNGSMLVWAEGDAPESCDSIESAMQQLTGVSGTSSAVVPLVLRGDPRALGEAIVVDKDVLNGRPTLRLIGTTRQGAPVTTWVDAQSFLIVRQSRTLWARRANAAADGERLQSTIVIEYSSGHKQSDSDGGLDVAGPNRFARRAEPVRVRRR